MYRDQTFSAVVLAAGSGKRMGTSVAKQYLPLLGKPLMVYALDVFAKSPVDEIILVGCPRGDGVLPAADCGKIWH